MRGRCRLCHRAARKLKGIPSDAIQKIPPWRSVQRPDKCTCGCPLQSLRHALQQRLKTVAREMPHLGRQRPKGEESERKALSRVSRRAQSKMHTRTAKEIYGLKSRAESWHARSSVILPARPWIPEKKIGQRSRSATRENTDSDFTKPADIGRCASATEVSHWLRIASHASQESSEDASRTQRKRIAASYA